MTIILK